MSDRQLTHKERGIYEDPVEIDPHLWEELASLHPDEVCVRAEVRYHKDQKCYLVPFLNKAYACCPSRRIIENIKGGHPGNISFQFYLVLLTYLLRALSLGISSSMVTGNEIKGGNFFFKGPHALFTRPLENRFGHDPKAFLDAGLLLGGKATQFGDASFRLWPLPRIPMGYILWEADEEFPARLVITFDAHIDKHFPLDVIWAMVNEVGLMLLKSV